MQVLLPFILFGFVAGQLHKHFEISQARSLADSKIHNVNPEVVYFSHYISMMETGKGDICDCSAVADLELHAQDIHGLYYFEKVRSLCGCTDTRSSHNPDFEKVIQDSNDLETIVWTAFMSAAKGSTQSAKQANVLAINKIRELMTSEGLFRSSFDDQTSGSVENTLLVLEVLASLQDSEVFSQFSAEMFEKAFSLIPSKHLDNFSSPLIVAPLSKLTDKKLRLLAPQVLFLTQTLIELASTDDVRIVARAIEGLRVLATYKSAPLFIGLRQSKFVRQDGGSLRLEVDVVDALGLPITSAVEVMSVKNVGKDGFIVENQPAGDRALEIPFESLSVGRHIAQLSVVAEGRSKPVVSSVFFVVTDPMQLVDIRVGITDGTVSRSELTAVAPSGGSLVEFEASSAASDSVYVEFAIAAHGSTADHTKKPHQTVVRFEHKETGRVTLLSAKKMEPGSGLKAVYAAHVSLADRAELFQHLSGPYDVSLLVADVTYAAPLCVSVGSVRLSFVAPLAPSLPLYAKSLLHASDTTLIALPEIVHVMRPPAKKASDLMATVFAILTLVPLGVFLSFVVSLRPDVRAAFQPSGFTLCLCLILILALYVGYWLALEGVSFYQTIRYMCIAGPIFALVGRYSLNSVSAGRTSSATPGKYSKKE